MIKNLLLGLHSGYSAFKPISQRSITRSPAYSSETLTCHHGKETVLDRVRNTNFAVSNLTLAELQKWLELAKDKLKQSYSLETIINTQTLITKLNTLTSKDYQTYCHASPFETYHKYIAEVIMLYHALNHDTANIDTPDSEFLKPYQNMPCGIKDKISSYIVNIIQTSLAFLNEYPDLTLDNFYAICHLLKKSSLDLRIAPIYLSDIMKKLSMSYNNITSLCSNPLFKETFYNVLEDILKDWDSQGLRFQSMQAEAFKRRLTYHFREMKSLDKYMHTIDNLVDSSTRPSVDSEDFSGPERITTAFDFT